VTGFTEDEIVAVMRRLLATDDPEVRLGVGDDAALVQLGDRLGILTVDMLVEGVHFDLRTTSARDLGYKAIVVNVSDVAAMGGSPRYGLVALAMPVATDARWVVELYGGMREAAGEYALSLVGGDTSRGDRVVLSVTVTGEVMANGAVTRGGARPGDLVVVTGTLGASAGGLALIASNDPSVRRAASTSWGRELMAAHLRPTARVGEGQTLAQAGATAMMDLSDGLATDLPRLCRESGVGASLRLAALPVAAGLGHLAEVIDAEPLRLALAGGEDYELLATLPPESVAGATAKLKQRFGTPLTVIGEITTGTSLVAVRPDGAEEPMPEGGWDHFGN
jgi:thiamine-monophosphate kinase